MIRKAFVMSVNSGSEAAYAERHQAIWPELKRALHDHGIHNYSIFLLKDTRQLFGYAELESEERWQALAQTMICKDWWQHMRELMPHHADGSPVSRDLREVFHLE